MRGKEYRLNHLLYSRNTAAAIKDLWKFKVVAEMT